MSLDQVKQQRLRQWLENKKVSQTCPACGFASWQTGDIIAAPTPPGGGGTVIGGPSHPMLQMICENCAHVRLFSTVMIGLSLEEKPPDTSPAYHTF